MVLAVSSAGVLIRSRYSGNGAEDLPLIRDPTTIATIKTANRAFSARALTMLFVIKLSKTVCASAVLPSGIATCTHLNSLLNREGTTARGDIVNGAGGRGRTVHFCYIVQRAPDKGCHEDAVADSNQCG